MQEILQYLKVNQGHPIYGEDIQQAFPQLSSDIINKELISLIKKGLIYPYNNGFYLTRLAESKLASPLQTTLASNPYSIARQRQKGITLENRDQYFKAWSNHFIESLNQFKKNHPELSNLFDILAAKTAEELDRSHDPREFAKDVQAIFNKFSFDVPELKYGPVEISYNIPETLNSIEHAIAESIQRLGKYSARHKSYVVDSKKYREVYDKVEQALNDINISKIFVETLDLKQGSFVQKKTIEDKFTLFISKTYNIPVKDSFLIKTSLSHLDTKINGILKSISPYTFYEGEETNEIVNSLYNFIKLKDGNKIFINFVVSCPDKLINQIVQPLFTDKDYKGVNFTNIRFPVGVTISNCDFAEANFTSTEWNGVTVENNNFYHASFLKANFITITIFKNNNIDQANFKEAKISPEIDTDVNTGIPVNYLSLKLTKQEMEDKGFKNNESFDHVGLYGEKQVPGRDADIKGERWVKYVQATPTAPFPKELYDLFNLHNVPVSRFLGWIGGTYDSTNKTLYVTKVRSDLLQKSFELSKYFLDEAEQKGQTEFHGNVSTKNLRNFSKYKAELEQYFKGWQHVFMNQAVREAKNRGAEFIVVPVDNLSPQRNYDRLVNDIIKVPGGQQEEVPMYQYEIKNGWYIIPVDQITKFAKVNKLSWKIQSDEFYEFEKELKDKNISYYLEGDTFIIDHKGNVDLNSLTSLPDKVVFNNQGNVNLYSLESLPSDIVFNNQGNVYLNYLESLPDNIQFNNQGYVNLYDLTSLPDKVVFNNQGNIGLYSLESLPDNKYEIFKNNGIVKYNNYKNTFDPRIQEKLSWNKFNNLLIFSKEEPSEDQKEAGNYKKKHVKKDGLDITIENKKGSTRSGTDSKGKKWSIKMKNDYGYIKGTVGKDKDHVDCFLSNNYKEDKPVFVVNQLNDKGNFDEHKCMLGFENVKDAEKAYLDNYEKGWSKYEKELIEMSIEDFKEWVKDKKETKKPAEEIEQKSSLKLSWWNPQEGEYEEPLEESPQEKSLTPSLKFDMDYRREKSDMINMYLDRLSKAKKEGDATKVERIKKRIDELVSLGSLNFNIVKEATLFPTSNQLLKLYNKYAKGYDYTKEAWEVKEKLLYSAKLVYENTKWLRNEFRKIKYNNPGVDEDAIDEYIWGELDKKGPSSGAVSLKQLGPAIKKLESAQESFDILLGIDGVLDIMHDAGSVIGIMMHDWLDEDELFEFIETLNQLRDQGTQKLSWQMLEFKVIRGYIPWENIKGERQGQINITYNELINILGEPSEYNSEDGKSQARWILYFPQYNEYASVYDYKEKIPKENVIDWHISGNNTNVIDFVKHVMGFDKDITEFKLSWQEPNLTPLADNNHIQEFLVSLNRHEQEDYNKYIQDYLDQYLNLISITSQDAINLVTHQGPAMIDYRGPYDFKYYYIGERDTEYGSVWDIIGERNFDDYEVLSAGIGENPLTSTSSKKLSWDSGKDSYKDLEFNYNSERGQGLNFFEPGRDKDDGNNALSPLVMKQPWNTENLVTDFDQDQQKEHSLNWTDRSNNQLWV